MSFGQAINTCFKKYVVWEGRASRAEYWWWILFQMILVIPASTWYQSTDAVAKTISFPFWFMLIISLGLFLPSLSVLIRRLHDTNRSGGWWWIGLIPFVGSIILLVFTLLPSVDESNRYNK